MSPDTTMTVDFLIVGAGIAGASLGYQLAPHGSVALLEMEAQPGYHTTGRSAAFYAETYGGPAIQPLTSASKAFLYAPPEGFSDVPLIHQRGALHIFAEDQRHLVTDLYEELRTDLASVTLLDKEDLKLRLPMLRPDWCAGAIADPDCGDMDVAAIHQGYLRGIKRLKGEIINNAHLISAKQQGSSWIAKTDALTINAGTVINCAGAWADDVAEKAGLTGFDMRPLRRTIAQAAPFDHHDPMGPVIIDIEERFYFKPDANGWLVCPGDETYSPPCDAQPEAEDIAWAAHWLEAVLKTTAPKISNKWAGLRTFATDRKPVIGFDPRCENFFWSAGQGGYGIQTADGWSRLAASTLLGNDMPSDLRALKAAPNQYSPARFL